jgi:PAS domain S-box-containing protein
MNLATRAGLAGAHVLVVADVTSRREGLCDLVRELGHKPHSGAGATGAFAIIQSGRTDVVIVDVGTPQGNAERLLDKFGVGDLAPTVPVVVVTSGDCRHARLPALKAGAADILSWPSDHRELAERLRQVIAQRLAHRTLESRQAELADVVRKQAMDWSVLVGAIPELVIGIDAGGRIASVNQASRMLPDNPIGEPAGALSLPDRPSGFQAIVHDILAGRRSQYHGVHAGQEEGLPAVIEVSVRPVRDEFMVRGAVLIARDVTEARRTQMVLEEREARFRALVETSPDLVILVSPNERVEYVSRTLAGFPVSRVIGSPFVRWVDPEHVPALRQALAQAAESDDVVTCEVRGRSADGQVRWARCRMRRFVDGDPRVLLFLSDTTEQRRIDDERAAAATFFQQTLDSLSVQVGVLDSHGMVMGANRAWLDDPPSGATPEGARANFPAACEAEGTEAGRRLAAGVREVLAGRRASFRVAWRCVRGEVPKSYVVDARPQAGSTPLRFIVTRTEMA